MIPWLGLDDPFPDVRRALRDPNGLLAAGADLAPERLLSAYRHGIFPWYGPGEPILWWSPDPRMVLEPAAFKTSRSLAKRLRRPDYEVRVDSDFEAVMRACAAPRPGQRGTWIVEDMVRAYRDLHALGHAHSVETWLDGELVGGLYGVAVGRMFYGESMFSRVSDASKIALAHLCRQLERWGFGLIDCQMETTHLASLGARPIARSEFLDRLRVLVNLPGLPGKWSFADGLVD
ncbi:leucyl/phenylalanyl-tRNA--protein transferase [Parasulfuritortus cantonensis]|uniref:Leucyl/phenylalanyl-tRNA--protein transferase n=1 Tax=Parasulfuritortus cantonensis TaxID=2528202 RepID=A0A4R1BGR2_9PROT|nr:leucyl/phenylalanyl-tRNA--protein transferase [Parasulfuritortus cantonensis]TCJ16381.1 leucyl/phenylalanyl-tRNA--protein transferase [Parasulfuritortus cantonensis]